MEQRERLKTKYSTSNILDIGKLPNKSIDQEFLQKIVDIIEENMANEEFDVKVLQTKMAIIHAQLHHKLKATSNQSANEIIQCIRLTKAAEMLKGNTANRHCKTLKGGVQSHQRHCEALKGGHVKWNAEAICQL